MFHCQSLGHQLKCVATLAGGKDPIGSREKWQNFVMGLSIETIVNVARRALDQKTLLQCVVRAGKIELI